MPYYAVVFKRQFKSGEHWNPAAPVDDPDRRQDWPAGALYSHGSVLGQLPEHLEAIQLEGPPPDGAVWNVKRRTFEKASR